MFNRKILIVDDESNIETLYIPDYLEAANEIKEQNERYSQYDLEFKHIVSIDGAIEYLKTQALVDVLIIDYKFNNEHNRKSGVDLIKFVRENINKHCRVIFYTMNELAGIPPASYVQLINNQIFRIVDKANCSNFEFTKIIFEAVADCDIIVNSLERFWLEYKDVFEHYKYTFLSEEQKFSDILNHIRMDDEIGKTIIDKLVHKALIESVEVEYGINSTVHEDKRH